MIEHLTTRQRFYKANSEPKEYATLLRFCARGNVVWGVWELPWEIKDNRPVTLITCDLIRKDDKYSYAYKDQDETCGPCQLTCPVSFIKLANNPPDSKHGLPWRQQVLDAAQRKKENRKSFKEGDFIVFEDDSPLYFGQYGHYWDFEVLGKKPQRFYSIGEFGFTCRLSKSAMSSKFKVVSKEEYAKIRKERIEFRTVEAEKRRFKKQVFLD